nr:MAG TPA: hypothetical protein [Caudoviricetes sp.]
MPAWYSISVRNYRTVFHQILLQSFIRKHRYLIVAVFFVVQ